jgi:hypothetical protein
MVEVPIVCKVTVEIQADSDEQAIALAVDNASIDDVDEWQALQELSQGNINLAPISKAYVTFSEPVEDAN